MPANLIVDCSHANSSKDPQRQPLVFKNCVHQITEGNQSIVGMMLESNICSGNQKLGKDLSVLKYGVSITDGCIDFSTTDTLLREAREQIKRYRSQP